MSNTKISALPSASALTGVEVLPLVQSGATVGATVSQLLANPSINTTVSSSNLPFSPVSITNTYNGGTGNNTDFLLNRSGTQPTGGTQNLMDLQVAGASKFRVDSTGTLSATGNISTSAGVVSVPAGTSGANSIQFGGSATTGFYSTGAGNISTTSSSTLTIPYAAQIGYLYDRTGHLIYSAIVPTIASGFGTAPTITASTTVAFKVVVGTAPTGVGVLTFPTAATGWSCDVQNNTSNSTIVVGQTATTITSASFAAYSRTTGLAVNFNAGDVLTFTCMGF